MGALDVARLRMLAQGIEGARCGRPEEVVRRLGAMQAQEYRQALWAVGVRTGSATEAEVEQAVAAGKIVRTWPLRGTIHMVPPEDAKWMVKLSAPRVLASMKRRREELGLTSGVLSKSYSLLEGALAGGKRLTRKAAMELLESHGIDTSGQRGYHTLVGAALEGLICFGPQEGKEQTFVLLDEWAPAARELSREESLAELARKYFAGHGPATVHDFAWWAGLTVADAKAGVAGARAHLRSATAGGVEYWMAGQLADSAGSDNRVSSVHFLPGFDEYLLGYKDRGAVLDPAHAERVVPGKNGVFLPIVVEGGRVTGVWRRTAGRASGGGGGGAVGKATTARSAGGGAAVDVEAEPFERFASSREELLAAASRYGAFAGAAFTNLLFPARGIAPSRVTPCG